MTFVNASSCLPFFTKTAFFPSFTPTGSKWTRFRFWDGIGSASPLSAIKRPPAGLFSFVSVSASCCFLPFPSLSVVLRPGDPLYEKRLPLPPKVSVPFQGRMHKPSLEKGETRLRSRSLFPSLGFIQVVFFPSISGVFFSPPKTVMTIPHRLNSFPEKPFSFFFSIFFPLQGDPGRSCFFFFFFFLCFVLGRRCFFFFEGVVSFFYCEGCFFLPTKLPARFSLTRSLVGSSPERRTDAFLFFSC